MKLYTYSTALDLSSKVEQKNIGLLATCTDIYIYMFLDLVVIVPPGGVGNYFGA